MALTAKDVVAKFKSGRVKYNEDLHCEMLASVMLDRDRGSLCYFCVDAFISETTFWDWIRRYPTFADLYSFCKIYTRRTWEQDGLEIRDMTLPIGTVSYAFEYWKLIGWSRFGISKNSRIKLNLDPNDSPDKHYSQLLKQASEGDFTASEIKQLMEAVNVGLNTHQVFALQKEIDQLKSDFATMNENTGAHNTSTNKGIAQKD